MTVNFDAVEYIQKSRALGVVQELAEFQAQAMEKVIKEITHNQELTTKSDLAGIQKGFKSDLVGVKKELQIEIANLRVELIRWVLGMGLTTIITLAGLMATFIKLLH